MKAKGLTLVELLVALFVLGVLSTLALGALMQFMHTRSDLDASVSAQAKLRRIMEIFTQDLRSAVFGGLAGSPYATGRQSISFALIQGGAGYPVLPHDSGNNNPFPSASEAKVLYVDNTLDLRSGDFALMVNAAGDGVVFKVTQVNPVGPSEPGRWHVVHAGCGNTIPYTPNTLLFKVQPLGFRYDGNSKELRTTIGDSGEIPLAFDLSGFRIDYVYEAARRDVVLNPGGYDYTNPPSGGAPPLELALNGKIYTLRRLQLVLSTHFPSRGKLLERTYQAQVELASNTQFRVARILSCR